MSKKLTFCPLCDTHATSLGALGYREYFRCDGCGVQFSKLHRKAKSLALRQARKDKEIARLKAIFSDE